MGKALCVLALMILLPVFVLAEDNSLSRFTKDRKPIKVFVNDFKDDDERDQVISADFKKALENALRNRKSVTFDVVKTPGESTVQISGTIKKYQYLKKGPLNISPGISTLILDAAASAMANYAEMTVEFAVIETGSGKTLWKDVMTAYIKEVMTTGQSIPLVYDKITRTFLWKSFGKGK